MPCEECPDGHWECGEDPSELCQGGFRIHSMMSQAKDAAAMSNNPQAGVEQVVPAAPGDWTKVGEFIARYEIYYAWGHDGKPMVKIVPLTQHGQPLIAQRSVIQQQQQRYVREVNEHRGSGSRGG